MPTRSIRFQVRKNRNLWDVYVFTGRCWQFLEHFASFDWAMIMATGQDPYDRLPGWRRELRLVLEHPR